MHPPGGLSFLARVDVADVAAAQRVADGLIETLDPDSTAVAMFEAPNGGWSVQAHFDAAPDETAIRTLVEAIAGKETAGALSFASVQQRDWVAASLADLKPVRAGRFIVHGRHDRARVPVNAIGIEIEAALAFGTGHHGTTRGCLLALEQIVKRSGGPRRLSRHQSRRRRRKILDVGTGTGVLAIAAAKAFQCAVLASDIDAAAVRVARENAHANRTAPLIEFICAAGVSQRRFRERGRYDLIFANILLDPLKGLARPIAGLVAPRGRVLLSGLLAAQASAALSAYRAQGLRLERRITIEGWTTLIMVSG